MGEGLIKSHPLLGDYWQLTVLEKGGGVPFLHCWDAHIPLNHPQPCSWKQPWLNSVGHMHIHKVRKVAGGLLGRKGEREWGDWEKIVGCVWKQQKLFIYEYDTEKKKNLVTWTIDSCNCNVQRKCGFQGKFDPDVSAVRKMSGRYSSIFCDSLCSALIDRPHSHAASPMQAALALCFLFHNQRALHNFEQKSLSDWAGPSLIGPAYITR